MLTKCPECGHDVSTRAEKCPNCGAPLEAAASPSEANKTTLIEKTSKDIKLDKLTSGLLIITGVIAYATGRFLVDVSSHKNSIFYGSYSSMAKLLITVGLPCLIIGTCWFIVVSILAWWRHG